MYAFLSHELLFLIYFGSWDLRVDGREIIDLMWGLSEGVCHLMNLALLCGIVFSVWLFSVSFYHRICICHMEDERDVEYAIWALDQTECGRKGRRLHVEWTKVTCKHLLICTFSAAEFICYLLLSLMSWSVLQQEQGGRKSASSRRSANLKPSKTLFVIKFPYHT